MQRMLCGGPRGWCWLTTGSVFVLAGCDPTVRDTVLAGVQQAATGLFTSFIAAFFESLAAEEEEITTVMRMVEEIPKLFA
jgi:hypothetical protein